MNNMKIELDYDGIGKLLKSNDAMNLCESFARKYNGDRVKTFVGFDRAHSIVYRNSKEKRKGKK